MPAGIDTWMKTAEAGEVYTYYLGFLAADKSSYSDTKRLRMAAKATRLAREGKVFLLQRRLDKAKFEYLAIKAKQENKRRTWWDREIEPVGADKIMGKGKTRCE